jgi:anti-sigma factor RsiW
MNCLEVQELLSAYYDGELADDRRSSVDEHLTRCSECARELAGFEKLAAMANTLGTPVPPEHIWSQLEQQLDNESTDPQPVVATNEQLRSLSFPAPRLFALAASVLVAVGVGWITYTSWFESESDHHDDHDRFAVDLRHYLEEFSHDPDAAQQILLTNYNNHLVGPEQAIKRVGYRPAVAVGLPEGYALESTHVMKTPCCTCLHSICTRRDGSKLAIFEHDDECCDDEQCCLINLDDPIAVAWKRGTRRIMLIGVRDSDEVEQMVAQLDWKKQPLSN